MITIIDTLYDEIRKQRFRDQSKEDQGEQINSIKEVVIASNLETKRIEKN